MHTLSRTHTHTLSRTHTHTRAPRRASDAQVLHCLDVWVRAPRSARIEASSVHFPVHRALTHAHTSAHTPTRHSGWLTAQSSESG